jgi:hypothetical protein
MQNSHLIARLLIRGSFVKKYQGSGPLSSTFFSACIGVQRESPRRGRRVCAWNFCAGKDLKVLAQTIRAPCYRPEAVCNADSMFMPSDCGVDDVTQSSAQDGCLSQPPGLERRGQCYDHSAVGCRLISAGRVHGPRDQGTGYAQNYAWHIAIKYGRYEGKTRRAGGANARFTSRTWDDRDNLQTSEAVNHRRPELVTDVAAAVQGTWHMAQA